MTVLRAYQLMKGMNENAECTYCKAKFCIAHGGLSEVVSHVKTKRTLTASSKQSFQ
jgi:hypothetical protein